MRQINGSKPRSLKKFNKMDKPLARLNKSSLMAQWVKNLPVMQETQERWVQSLGQENPLEKEIEPHSDILAWEVPWTGEPGGLQFIGSQSVRHSWVTNHREGSRKKTQITSIRNKCGHVTTHPRITRKYYELYGNNFNNLMKW